MKLSDAVLHNIVQLVQLGILTGTDVADHLRMIKLTLDENDQSTLVLDPAYKEQFDVNLMKMQVFLEEQMKQQEEDNG